MSVDRFFEEFDEIERKRKEKLEEEKREKEKADFTKFINNLSPTFLSYIEQLKKRNLKVEHSISERDIKFMLFYNDGGERGFSLNIDGITHYSVKDNGGRISAEEPAYQKYSGEKIASLLQKVIKDFQFYSERHKGIRFND
ncbi:MAG: hypothetical protein K8S87_03825 [Planctomycetes bacterium]|nr:hypothetical protein [Planctomycetota bacterium]